MEQDELSTEIRIEVTRESLREALDDVTVEALVTKKHAEELLDQLFYALVTKNPEKIVCSPDLDVVKGYIQLRTGLKKESIIDLFKNNFGYREDLKAKIVFFEVLGPAVSIENHAT